LKGVSRAVALWLLMAGPAGAQSGEPVALPTWYAGPFVGYALPDSARDAKDGLNLHLVGGRVLAEAVAVELNLFATQFDADVSGGADTDLTGAGLDLALGIPEQGRPVFLLGAGAVQQKIADVGKTSAFGSLGLGYYLPFSFGDELWRLEARYHVISTDHPALPDEDLVEDVRLNLGVLFTFGREEESAPEPRESVPEAPPPAPALPVEPVVEPFAPGELDEDGDGVADGDDRCPGTADKLEVDAKGCVVPEDFTLRGVHFDSSSSQLTAYGYTLLRSLAASMQAEPGMKLEVGGHADKSGRKAANQQLSQERADVVREFLVNTGIAANRLTARGYGDTQPVNDNSTLELRAFNRRVQFRRTD